MFPESLFLLFSVSWREYIFYVVNFPFKFQYISFINLNTTVKVTKSFMDEKSEQIYKACVLISKNRTEGEDLFQFLKPISKMYLGAGLTIVGAKLYVSQWFYILSCP